MIVNRDGYRQLIVSSVGLALAVRPDISIASWSLRFSEQQEGVITELSGMSTLEQVRGNIKTNGAMEPLTLEEEKALAKAMAIYRESGPLPQREIEKYRGITYHNVPVTALLQAYSICQLQPDPGFSDDNNYVKSAFAENAHLGFFQGLPKQQVTAGGAGITELVEKEVKWLTENSF